MIEARAQHIETSDGVTIGFWTSGVSKDTVVLLPSVGRSGRDFYDLSRVLAEAGFRAVALDLPGGWGEHGAS